MLNAPVRAAPLRILVVDDDESLLQTMVTALNRAGGYAAEGVDSGLKAAVRLGSSARPDLLIIDIFIPEMTGVELCRILRADPTLADLPVVIVTGYRNHPAVDELRTLGYSEILFKPFRIAALLESVQRSLHHLDADHTDPASS